MYFEKKSSGDYPLKIWFSLTATMLKCLLFSFFHFIVITSKKVFVDHPKNKHDLFSFQMRPYQRVKIKNYAARTPQWKKIDQEIQQLTKKYDHV